jgi:hypothetical protein
LDGRESVEDEPRSGSNCPSKTEENVTKVSAVVWSDRRLTVRMVGSKLLLNHQTVHDNFTEKLIMRKICANLVLKHLTNEQKETEGMCGWTFLNASDMTKNF